VRRQTPSARAAVAASPDGVAVPGVGASPRPGPTSEAYTANEKGGNTTLSRHVLNTSGAAVSGLNRIWVSGIGTMARVVGDTSIPSGTEIQTRRTVASNSSNGPFPHGCRLSCGLRPPTTGSVQVNGVRVGFRNGAAATTLRTTPTRVYDSRSTGGPLAPDATRTISLAGAIPRGAVGALLSRSDTGCNNRGTLRLARAGATPLATAIQWARTGDQLTTSATTAIDANRAMLVKSVGSTGTTHVIVDVLGYLTGAGRRHR
jgi:hypothetical protein